ncbi:MAG TPA: glycosyltransferase family 2 protein [Bacteroidia bacterium]|nr:glycosyltransferase family 2 protein [Bacteroidia bacterium]
MIFIIISVYNRKELTSNCLSSLQRQTYKYFETIIIDDGSTDGTSEMICEKFPGVHILKGDGNLWWAGATNVGIEYVLRDRKANDSDYILTLNNDLEVPEKYLETLAYNASVYKRSILGSVSVDITSPDRMNFCGISWNEFTGKCHEKAKDYKYLYQELIGQRQIIDSDMLPGRGTFMPIGVFNEIGLYDSTNFPQYAADEDFSLRARRNGWKLIIPTDTYLKSHITATGINMENVQFSLRYYKQLFFSIKSPLNLKIRYRWAMKNTPLKIFYFLLECSRLFISVSFKTIKVILN